MRPAAKERPEAEALTRRARTLLYFALVDGLAAPFVAFNLDHFDLGTLMLLAAFAALGFAVMPFTSE